MDSQTSNSLIMQILAVDKEIGELLEGEILFEFVCNFYKVKNNREGDKASTVL